MLAVKRIANVPGRIIFLILSIHTKSGIKMAGVPFGTKWENIMFVLFNHPKIINLNQSLRENNNVNAKCLVEVKIKGNNPMKLLNKTNINKQMNK